MSEISEIRFRLSFRLGRKLIRQIARNKHISHSQARLSHRGMLTWQVSQACYHSLKQLPTPPVGTTE